jgi:hypothetical protein
MLEWSAPEVLTAYYTTSLVKSIEKEKINMVLAKPIAPQLLMQIIEEAVWVFQHSRPDKQ